ncbi:hypothetical protein AA313_de0209188 [Arthrobotrys entomopaga]|nr:hypothetical protein AA313_de0209188 [Arthrobotrys entomopaga]
MSFFSGWGKVAQVAKEKVVTLNIPTFSDKGDVDGDTEDDSAVSRALREYYKEKDGFVPDWLTHTAISPNRNLSPNPAANSAYGRPTGPPRMQSGPGQSALGDIFGDAPKSAPPVQQQQFQPPPPQAQPQPQQAASAPAPRRMMGLPGGPRAGGGLPGGPRAGVRPFMAVKREQQQQREAASSAPPQQQQGYYQAPPPPPQPQAQHLPPPRQTLPPRQTQPPSQGGRRTFADNSYDNYSGFGGAPGFYGR